jgi:hypothetical protein
MIAAPGAKLPQRLALPDRAPPKEAFERFVMTITK